MLSNNQKAHHLGHVSVPNTTLGPMEVTRSIHTTCQTETYCESMARAHNVLT